MSSTAVRRIVSSEALGRGGITTLPSSIRHRTVSRYRRQFLPATDTRSGIRGHGYSGAPRGRAALVHLDRHPPETIPFRLPWRRSALASGGSGSGARSPPPD